MLRTKNASGDDGLHVTGDHWRIEGLTVAHGSKGIVLDGSVGTAVDGVEVFDIGAEAVHFRTCSSDGVLHNSYIHDTGMTHPRHRGTTTGRRDRASSRTACRSTSSATRRTGNTFGANTVDGAIPGFGCAHAELSRVRARTAAVRRRR